VNIRFGNKTVDARIVRTYPSKFRLGDFILVNGEPIEVVTVQKDCPLWESPTKTKTVVIFKTAAGNIIPVNGLSGVFEVMRPKSFSSGASHA
jgi:hypothetical protein